MSETVLLGSAVVGVALILLIIICHCIQVNLRRASSPSLLTSMEQRWSWAAVDEAIRRFSLRWSLYGFGALSCRDQAGRPWRVVSEDPKAGLPSEADDETSTRTSSKSVVRQASAELDRRMRPPAAGLNLEALRVAISNAEVAGIPPERLDAARDKLERAEEAQEALPLKTRGGGYTKVDSRKGDYEPDKSTVADAPLSIDDAPSGPRTPAVQAYYDTYYNAYTSLYYADVSNGKSDSMCGTDPPVATADVGVGPEPSLCDCTSSCWCLLGVVGLLASVELAVVVLCPTPIVHPSPFAPTAPPPVQSPAWPPPGLPPFPPPFPPPLFPPLPPPSSAYSRGLQRMSAISAYRRSVPVSTIAGTAGSPNSSCSSSDASRSRMWLRTASA